MKNKMNNTLTHTHTPTTKQKTLQLLIDLNKSATGF